MAKKLDWAHTKWRPMMGWCYMITCITDFIVFPVLWSILQAYNGGQVTSQWNPITLQGAGLYHLAMGAVLGVAAWSRGQEKMAGVDRPGMIYQDPYTTQTNTTFEQQYPIHPTQPIKGPRLGPDEEL